MNSDIHSYNTRIRDNFSVPYFRRSASKSCFIYQSINNWNSLPEDLKQKKNQANFNRILRKYLVSQYWITDITFYWCKTYLNLQYWPAGYGTGFLSPEYLTMRFTGTILISFYYAGFAAFDIDYNCNKFEYKNLYKVIYFAFPDLNISLY